jgi:hypothetical protein
MVGHFVEKKRRLASKLAPTRCLRPDNLGFDFIGYTVKVFDDLRR